MKDIQQLLAAREQTHGKFYNVAATAQGIKHAMHRESSHIHQTPITREALDSIAGKMARIVCGGSSKEHWEDVIGYAMLAMRELEEGDRSGYELRTTITTGGKTTHLTQAYPGKPGERIPSIPSVWSTAGTGLRVADQPDANTAYAAEQAATPGSGDPWSREANK